MSFLYSGNIKEPQNDDGKSKDGEWKKKTAEKQEEMEKFIWWKLDDQNLCRIELFPLDHCDFRVFKDLLLNVLKWFTLPLSYITETKGQ